MKKEQLSILFAKGVLLFIILTSIMYFFYVLFFTFYYIHESGHIIFGFIGSTLNGKVPNFKISSWIQNPQIPFIKFPQQTKIYFGFITSGFIFGGIIFALLVVFALSFILYKRNKKIESILLLVIFLIHELIGNFLCGTDNLRNNPHTICAKTNFFSLLIWFVPILFMFFMFRLFTHSWIYKRIVINLRSL